MVKFFIFVLLSGFLVLPLKSQCNLQNLNAHGYFHSECNNYQFQSVIGSMNNVFGQCGQFTFSPPFTVNSGSTGTLDFNLKGVILFPVPTNDYLTIQMPVIDNYKILLFNSIGIFVREISLSGIDEYTLDMRDSSPGYYFIKVINSKNLYINCKITKL
ncbi:MAG: hypothetical protein IPH57_18660 [Saprospiraceae bacterium]|nr:hypothetical protein [Saprospiraceae bacterium]